MRLCHCGPRGQRCICTPHMLAYNLPLDSMASNKLQASQCCHAAWYGHSAFSAVRTSSVVAMHSASPECFLQGKGILQSQQRLPDLPSNAQYVYHDNVCYDWGTFGWALANSVLDVSNYKYLVFMNSSIRGPHLPAYWPVSTCSSHSSMNACHVCWY